VGYRVVHCGAGNIWAAALRAILQHPDLELVGHFVSTPAKAARDSGAVLGAAPVGVTTTNEWADVIDPRCRLRCRQSTACPRCARLSLAY